MQTIHGTPQIFSLTKVLGWTGLMLVSSSWGWAADNGLLPWRFAQRLGKPDDFALAAKAPPAPASPRPNVILIMADDLGWMDLHVQGNEKLRTPNLDRLASQGLRFTDAYAAAPVCSPTRAAMLTGQAPARLKITNHIPDRPQFTPDQAVLDPAPALDHLPLEHVTVAECFRDAGYRTGFMGKWHLCGRGKEVDFGRGDPRYHPEKQGFEVNVGGCAWGGPPTFFDPYKIHNLPSRKEGEYLPDRLADEAIGFIRRHREEPFLLFLWNYAVHWPMEAPEALIEHYVNRQGPGIKDPRYAGMIEALDASLGRLLKALDDLKLADNTLVIFTSDNGGYSGVADNRPLRLGKGYLYEGGIRVPLIMRWPGVIKAGSVSHVPVISMDFYPTLLEAAGIPQDPAQPLDGESLWPVLKGEGGLRREAIFFHYPNYAWHRSNRLGGAIRQGNYKLIENFDDGSVELFDLASDLSEQKDLAAQEPELASQLRGKLKAWQLETGAAMPVRR